MKLFYAPNACSVGIHILLEEIGIPFEAEAIDLRARQQFSSAFLAVNPKGKIPALVRGDKTLLTEFGAIAYWLARSHPQSGLLADDLESQARALELLDEIVGTVHMRGFVFIISPQKFLPDEAGQEALRARGKTVVQAGFASLSKSLGAKDYLLGDFGIADAALFYVTHWANHFGIDMPDNLAAFHARMMQRPCVQRVLARELASAS